MGFLDKLFAKKICEICGGEIGILGNKKLVDGDCCKDCAAKLSPWFTDRKESTVAEIKEQIAYREANAAELKNSFRPTQTLGDYYKMYIMFENGCPSKFVISNAANIVEANADIIKFMDVVSCNVDIRDSKTEVKRKTESGEQVSYNPPRYEFRYEFYIELGINSPYFDKIRFKVNRNTVKLISELQTHRASSGIGQFLLSNNDFDPTYNPEFRQYQQMCGEIAEIVQKGQNPQKFQTASDIPEEILENKRQEAFRDKTTAEEDPKKRLALYEAECARVKDNPALTEYAEYLDRQRTLLQYACMTPEEQAAKMVEKMQQAQVSLMKDSGLPEETVAAASAAMAAGAAAAMENKQAESKSKKCPDCGATDQNGKFCEYCGAKLN